MTIRKPVSAQKNVWFDSQQVGEEDLALEQNANDQVVSSLINNHVGNGVVPQDLVQNILLDTSVIQPTVGTLDGKPLQPSAQPSDTIGGVQLAIDLTGSNAAGRKRIKVAVFGLDFAGNLQYDTFYFSKNDRQVTARHYTQVLSVLINDMLGANDKSFNLGGKLVVSEAPPFAVSRDTVMVGQTAEPNLFFRDFYLDAAYATLGSLISSATSGYNTDGLGISTGYKQLRKLMVNDVSTQLGQKFKATTTNIQKLTLLMAVENTVTPLDLTWSGDLVVSIYALQSSVSSPSDLVPSLAIDYPPNNLPLAQVSFNYTTLQNNGTVLNGNLQPVEFVFSNTPVANGILTVGNYYVVTVKRSGSANKCNLMLPVGSDRLTDARVTIFNGTTWVDIPEEDLWFQVSTDAVKVTDGQAYDAGQGITLPKVANDPRTGAAIDNALKNISFSSSLPFYGVLKAETFLSGEVQDQRTGNPVMSRQQLVPNVSLVNSTELTRLRSIGEPLVLGSVQDRNVKIIDAANSTISSSFYHHGLFKNKVAIKLNEANNDPTNNLHLLTALFNGDLTEAKFTPNSSQPNTFYRIASTQVLTMKYGDLNGDGIVDDDDSAAMPGLLGESLNMSPSAADYSTGTNYFTSASPVTYTIKDSVGTVLRTATAQLIVDAVDGTVAVVRDMSFNFTTLTNLLTCSMTISGSSSNNNGVFNINLLKDLNNVQFKKQYRDVNYLLRTLRADISNDGYIHSDDASYLTDYTLGVQPIPALTLPQSRIGTTFRVLLLTLENFVDRNDDYPNNVTNRSTSVHTDPDVLMADATFQSHQYSSPIPFTITKRLAWRSDLVAVSSKAKFVPASFSSVTAAPLYTVPAGIDSASYPVTTDFDPGRNDVFVPQNLIMGPGGQLVNKDGSAYKVDYEVGVIVFNAPIKDFTTERSINVLSDFVADFNNNGTTRLGYRAMRFADGSYVKNGTALALNQLRFTVSLQAFSPDLDGYSVDGYTGIIVDDRMGVYFDPMTGILKLNFSHLKEDLVALTLSTKVQITVYLKKAGFNNPPMFIDSATMANILGLV